MALQDIRLPRLDSFTQLVDQRGVSSITFSQWWDAVAGQLEAGINGINDAINAAAAAQSTANVAVGDAAAANANANTRQPGSTSLTALAALNGTGLVEQTGPNAFTDRAIGVSASTSIPTRADADGRYVRQNQTTAPVYSAYGGQTVSAAYIQAEAQATDNAVKAVSAALASLVTKLQTINVLT